MKAHKGPPPKSQTPFERIAEGNKLLWEMLAADTSDKRRRQILNILFPVKGVKP